MAYRTTRNLLLLAAATVAAVLLVRLAGMVFTWHSLPGPLSPHYSRLAWMELGLEAIIVLLAAAAAWWILRRQQVDEREQVRRDHLAEVGALSSGLVHEIRNYLNALRTNIALVRKAAPSDEGHQSRLEQRVRRLEETTASLEELLADFLTFARPAQDRMETIDVEQLVREVVDFVRFDVEQAGVDFQVEVAPTLPSVRADRAKLKRAILNLLVNARQATPEGGKISVRLKTQADSVFLEVADTGCGIPEEDRSRLFDSFFSTKSEGTGLGLAIVKRTIEDLSGTIDFESVVGKGTTFRITLPACPETAEVSDFASASVSET